MKGPAARCRAAGDLCPRAVGAAAGHTPGPPAKEEGGHRDTQPVSAGLSQSNWAAEGAGPGHSRVR